MKKTRDTDLIDPLRLRPFLSELLPSKRIIYVRAHLNANEIRATRMSAISAYRGRVAVIVRPRRPCDFGWTERHAVTLSTPTKSDATPERAERRRLQIVLSAATRWNEWSLISTLRNVHADSFRIPCDPLSFRARLLSGVLLRSYHAEESQRDRTTADFETSSIPVPHGYHIANENCRTDSYARTRRLVKTIDWKSERRVTPCYS